MFQTIIGLLVIVERKRDKTILYDISIPKEFFFEGPHRVRGIRKALLKDHQSDGASNLLLPIDHDFIFSCTFEVMISFTLRMTDSD